MPGTQTAIEITNFKIACIAIVHSPHSQEGEPVHPTVQWNQQFDPTSPNFLHQNLGEYDLILQGQLDPTRTGILVQQNGTTINATFKTAWSTVTEGGFVKSRLRITTCTGNDGLGSDLIDFYVELSQQLGWTGPTP